MDKGDPQNQYVGQSVFFPSNRCMQTRLSN